MGCGSLTCSIQSLHALWCRDFIARFEGALDIWRSRWESTVSGTRLPGGEPMGLRCCFFTPINRAQVVSALLVPGLITVDAVLSLQRAYTRIWSKRYMLDWLREHC